MPRSARLARPVSVPAGGSSIIAVTPSRLHGLHAQVPPDRRADLVDDAVQPVRAGLHHRAVPVREQRAVRVGRDDGLRRGGERIGGRRHVMGMERARDRQRPQPGPGRRILSERCQLDERAGGHDLARAVHVGRSQPGRLDRGEHVGLVAAEYGGHAGRLGRGGGCHAVGPDPDQAHGVLRAMITPASTPAASSPTLWPATATDCAADRVGPGDDLIERGGDGGGHQQRLRDGGVPDLVGVGGCPAPDQIAAGELGPGLQPGGEAGQLQPGGEESRCLGTLTGSCDEEHCSSLHCRSPPYLCRSKRTFGARLCRKSTSHVRLCAKRPSTTAVHSVNPPLPSPGVIPVSSVTRRSRYRTVLGCTNSSRAVASSEFPCSR